MKQQNETLRSLATSPFGELLHAVLSDPAMLIWLDAPSNRRGHPNENLARELMELFSMGVGNYSEEDVKEAARALTGWTTRRGEFRFVESYHDKSQKKVLGKTGPLNGDDILKIVIDNPATAKRIAWRLCDLFFGEGVVSEETIDELSRELASRDLDVGWAVETILRSEAFFASNNIGTRVLAPVEYVVGAVRAFEMFDPPPSTLVLSEWTARLGQDLFYPPNVFGWPGGREWITTRSMIGRSAFATELARGSMRRPKKPVDTGRLINHIDANDQQTAVANFASTLLVPGSTAAFQERICDSVSASDDQGDTTRKMLEAILASPEAQLG